MNPNQIGDNSPPKRNFFGFFKEFIYLMILGALSVFLGLGVIYSSILDGELERAKRQSIQELRELEAQVRSVERKIESLTTPDVIRHMAEQKLNMKPAEFKDYLSLGPDTLRPESD